MVQKLTPPPHLKYFIYVPSFFQGCSQSAVVLGGMIFLDGGGEGA